MNIFRNQAPAGSNRESCGVLIARCGLILAVCASWALPRAADAASSAPGTFKQYCFQCHGEAAKMAALSLERLTSQVSIGDGFREWKKVATALEEGKMPPEGMPQPSAAERREAVSWIRSELGDYVEKYAGDPGRVTVRRLTSGEYAYTVEDLTGLKLDIIGNLAPDSVGGEGFTNFGDVQFMQDADLELYLGAAKKVADHAVIGAGPLEFYEDPGKSGFEFSAIHRIHEIYRANGFRAAAGEGGMPYGMERYGQAFYLSWRYLHREALGESAVALSEIAVREGVSARFLEHIWAVLTAPSPSYPTSEVVESWRGLPTPSGPDDKQADAAARAGAEATQMVLINWPRRLMGAGEQAAGGAGDERALVLDDTALKVEASSHMRVARRLRPGKPAVVNFSVVPMNPNSAVKPTVFWRNAEVKIRMKSDREEPGPNQPPLPLPPGVPLRSLLDEETIARLRFGKHPDGGEIEAQDFALAMEDSIEIAITAPEDAVFLLLEIDAEIDPDTAGDTVARATISSGSVPSRRPPISTLLGDASHAGFQAWKADVLEFGELLPQISHREPTPSDRDPIPAPFDNDYNTAERNWFHYNIKYDRDDAFIVEKMLDDKARRNLDRAWADLKASFEYHDAYLHFVAEKFGVDLDEKGIADLTDDQIEAMPAEPRQYAKALRDDYKAVMAAQQVGQARHVDDALRFAGRAWRRPLAAGEKQSLRAFYDDARKTHELDHTRTIRALLTRILVAPAFLYRLEQPKNAVGVVALSDIELASRLSYFLWASMPDEELMRAAAAGELSSETELRSQVKRMLADPKARRFATEFFGQWLGFYRFDQYRGVDSTRFPEFTDGIKTAMYDEAVSFFEHVVRQDRPAGEILSADYTFLNQALANHYGVEKEISSADKAELVEGANAFQRGGMLRLGAVLTATSAPLRTSPVKRGDWVLRRILGTPTPPPPADAGSIPADDKLFGGLSVSEQLAVHKRNPTCAACHMKIDPLGFPLERYDPVGRWRDQYPDGKAIEDSSELVDQTPLNGIDGLLDYLEAQDKQVLHTLSYKLLGYALGRTVAASDQPLIDNLAEAGGTATFSDLAATIVTSRQFRYRRGQEREDGPAGELASTPVRTNSDRDGGQ